MVYCMTETNLWPPGPENGKCPTSKGSAAVLPRGGASHLRRTYKVLAFMTPSVYARGGIHPIIVGQVLIPHRQSPGGRRLRNSTSHDIETSNSLWTCYHHEWDKCDRGLDHTVRARTWLKSARSGRRQTVSIQSQTLIQAWSTDCHLTTRGDESSADDRSEPPGRVRSRVV